MAKQKEGSLQERIQKLVKSRGGYIHKNLGGMTSVKGIADLTCCYKGFYVVFEVKVDDNTPSLAQGIHCRLVQHAYGITAVVWSIKEVEIVLDCLDQYFRDEIEEHKIQDFINSFGIDDGTRW